jgi:hypothetical protein
MSIPAAGPRVPSGHSNCSETPPAGGHTGTASDSQSPGRPAGRCLRLTSATSGPSGAPGGGLWGPFRTSKGPA